jgi:adenylate kinase
MRLALLGPPGSGKGTQSVGLRESYGIPHISSGDLLRDAVSRETDLGKQAKEYMTTGRLVPDELVLGMMRERIEQPDCTGGFLLDGFPRTVAQAEALGGMLDAKASPLDSVVALVVDRDQIVARLGGRRSCVNCGRLYHVTFDPPADASKCDKCGAELLIRDDDREATVRERLAVYEEQTAPLLDYYRSRGLLAKVDGLGPQQEISARIATALGSL